MKKFDAHCDVLYKMFLDSQMSFQERDKLHVTLSGLHKGGTKVQCFAIYVPEAVHPDTSFQAALHMVDIFFRKIIDPYPELVFVSSQTDLNSLHEDQIGAILTLEGCECIGSDLLKLRTLLRLGVRSVGLTWNRANSVADGALEERGAGLSQFGKQVVAVLNETHTWCDVSHLSEKGFWDCMELADYPIASHSNAYSLCPHPRNLRDDQIKALIERNGVMGITFVPPFLAGTNEATMTDVIRHLDYVCALGGENHVGFGSDFDGFDYVVEGLEDNSKYHEFAEELGKYYSENQVEKFLYHNFSSRFPK